MAHPVHLGKYRLIQLLASGGMGEVYLARHEGPAGFERPVVVKRVLRRFADDRRFTEMFVNEARVNALLIHPNVVQVYELGEEDGEYFIAMEYVHGRTVHQVLDKTAPARRVAPVPAAQICWQLLQGLDYAHRSQDGRGKPLNIVHRDVSPDNVMVSFDGVVKVTDFGIMKSGVVSNARSGMLQGKIAYLSPEQSQGLAVDSRADVYACGVLLHELLCGAPPFADADREALLRAVREAPVPPLRERVPDVPDALERVVMRALEKRPEARFATAADMAHALEAYVASLGESLTPAPLARWLNALFPGAASRAHGLAVASHHPGTVPLTGIGAALETELADLAPPAGRDDADAVDVRLRRHRWPIGVALGIGLLAASAAGWVAFRARPAAPAAVVATASGEGPSSEAASGGAPEASHPPASETSPVAEARPPEVVAPASRVSPITPASIFGSTSDEAVSRAQPPPPAAVAARPASPRSASRPGRLTVRVNPWANVFVNGKDFGVSPVGPLSLPVGRASVVLKNPELGLQRKVSVRITSNQEVLLKEDLLEAPTRGASH